MRVVARTASYVQKISDRALLNPALATIFGQAVEGICASGSVLLSEIARQHVSDGDRAALHSAVQQLSHRLKTDDQLDALPGAYLEEMASLADELPFFTLDGSDITKPHSRKLEYLDVVRDGSQKQRDPVMVGPEGVRSMFATRTPTVATTEPSKTPADEHEVPAVKRGVKPTRGRKPTRRKSVSGSKRGRKTDKAGRVKFPSPPPIKQLGYWTTFVEAGDGEGNHLPLAIDVFSTTDPAYIAAGAGAWTERFRKTVSGVLKHTGTHACWLMDRGFDDVGWMRWFHGRVASYVIRVKNKRMVSPGQREAARISVKALTDRLTFRGVTSLRSVNKSTHEEQCRDVPIAYIPICIDGVDHRQYLIVAKTGSKSRIMVVTDVCPTSDAHAGRVIATYLERWGNEETTRALKQLTSLEKVRVRSLVAIRRLANLAMIALGIQASMTLNAGRLARAVLDRGKEFVARVRFSLYRIWRVVQQDMRRALERRRVKVFA